MQTIANNLKSKSLYELLCVNAEPFLPLVKNQPQKCIFLFNNINLWMMCVCSDYLSFFTRYLDITTKITQPKKI